MTNFILIWATLVLYSSQRPEFSQHPSLGVFSGCFLWALAFHGVLSGAAYLVGLEV